MALKVVVNEKEPGVYAVSLFGPLDSATYPLFEEQLAAVIAKSPQAVILNMQGVDYISSLGIGSIFKVTKDVKAQKGSLLLINLQPQIKKVFDTVKALPEAIFSSIEEADAYLNEIQNRELEKKNKPL